MKLDPPATEDQTSIKLAIQSVSQARHLLQTVITSSESFDYLRAREALKELNRLIRQLGKTEARLRSRETGAPDPKVVAFPAPGSELIVDRN